MTTSETLKHIERGGGICGTCARAAEATPGNEGYSDCCHDRIEYDSEARRTLAEELAPDSKTVVLMACLSGAVPAGHERKERT